MAATEQIQSGMGVKKPQSDSHDPISGSPPESTLTPTSPDAKREEQTASPTTATQEYLTGWPLYLMMFALVLVALIVLLDTTIVATALPRITDYFNTLEGISWYAGAYLLAQASLLPMAGRAYTYFPFKATFVAFLVVFLLGSAICGAATSAGMLIGGRAVCGVGASGLFNGALMAVAVVSPPGKKALWTGVLTGIGGMGQVLGPVIGGSLTEHATWRWCFYLNLPVGAVTIGCILLVRLPNIPRKSWNAKTLVWDLDVAGWAIFGPACAMLLLALSWGGREYPWRSATVIGLFCGSVAAFAIFAVWEIRQQDQAMIPPRIAKIRVVYSAMIAYAFATGAMQIVSYNLSLWFQASKGKSPTSAGLFLLPSLVPHLVFTVLAGVLVSKIGLGLPPMVVGNALGVISHGLITTLTPSSWAGQWAGYQVLMGIGRGLSLQMPLLIAQNAVPAVDLATVTAILLFSQFLGIAILLNVAQNMFVSLLPPALRRYAPGIDGSAAIDAGATDFIAAAPEQIREAVVFAYNEAVTPTFYLGVAALLIALLAGFGVGRAKAEMVVDKGPKVEPSIDVEGGRREKGGPEET